MDHPALHSALSAEERDKVFDAAPEGVRKCVLSTNVAETSVTIDGVRFVCDSGRHRDAARPRTGAGPSRKGGSARRARISERAARDGRAPACARLCSEVEYERFRKNTHRKFLGPIFRASCCNSNIAGSTCDPRAFPCGDRPGDALESATWALREHGALTSAETLTPLGVYSRESTRGRQRREAAGAGVAVRADRTCDVAGGCARGQVAVRAKAAVRRAVTRGRRGSISSPHGDPFLGAHRVRSVAGRARRTQGKLEKWCRRMGLEEQRLVEMAKLQRQFSDACEGVGADEKEQGRRRGGGKGGDGEVGGSNPRGGGVERGRHSVLRHKRRLLRGHARARERKREGGSWRRTATAAPAGPTRSRDSDDDERAPAPCSRTNSGPWTSPFTSTFARRGARRGAAPSVAGRRR